MYTEAMKYSPLNLAMGEGENMAISAANRLTFHLKYKVSCLDVVQLGGLVQGSPGSVQLKLSSSVFSILLWLSVTKVVRPLLKTQEKDFHMCDLKVELQLFSDSQKSMALY